MLERNCQVFSVQHLACIGKILLTVQEGNFCYYLLMQSLENRRIDLFSHQPNYNMVDIEMCGNQIIFQDEEQFITFEHSNLLQKQAQPFISNYYLGVQEQISSNYLIRSKRIVDKETNENLEVDVILRSNDCNGFTTICSSLKNYICKQKSAIDYQLKTEFQGQAGEEERCKEISQNFYDEQQPFFVTSKGTLVLSFHLAQSKQKESDIASNQENKKVLEEGNFFQIVKYNLPYENENLEIFNAGINDLTEDEKKVIIYVIKNNTLKTDKLEFRQTEHFFVILGKNKIFFKKLALINDNETNQVGRSADKIGEFNNFQGIKTQIESKKCCYEFQCIDLSQLFTEKEQQGNYKISVKSGKQTENVIQISFEDIVVLWDLENNQELSQITNFVKLSTPETMIPSPFQVIEQPYSWAKSMAQTNDKTSSFGKKKEEAFCSKCIQCLIYLKLKQYT